MLEFFIILILVIAIAPWLILAVLALATFLIGNILQLLGMLCKLLLNIPKIILNNKNNSKEKEIKKQEELKQPNFILIEKQENFKTINYSTLYKGANTLKGNSYKCYAKVLQVEENNICYACMRKYFYVSNSIPRIL